MAVSLDCWWGYIAIYSSYIDIYMYSREEKLLLKKKVYLTSEVFKILRKQRVKQKISMAKIVCNLILEKYADEKLQ